jgi:hypothetical protein
MFATEGVASKVAVNVPFWEAMAVSTNVEPPLTQTVAGVTTRFTAVALCVSVPLAPVTVTGYVAAAVEVAVMIVSVDVPEPVTVVDEKLPLTPAGSVPALKITVPLKPFCAVTVTVYVVPVPAATVRDEGDAEMEKSGGGGTLTPSMTGVL